jgi:hypothetical protein
MALSIISSAWLTSRQLSTPSCTSKLTSAVIRCDITGWSRLAQARSSSARAQMAASGFSRVAHLMKFE